MRTIRHVAIGDALAWYREAMRLWKRAPVAYAGLALVVIALELGLDIIPVVGVALAQLVLPLAACSLLYATLAADRGERPRLVHLIAVLGARPNALAAVVVAGVATFAAEAMTANAVAGFDLLAPNGSEEPLAVGDIFAIYAAGVLVSLPFTFVPFAALFDNVGFVAAFRVSFAAFAQNPGPLLFYGGLSLALLLFGLLTSGIGLLLVLPWWAASSYAAWKDVFGVEVAAPAAQ